MSATFRRIESGLAAAIARRFGIDPPRCTATPTPEPALGDLAFTVAFELARTLRRPPRLIATELAEELGRLADVRSVVVAGGGYLNVFVDRAAFLAGQLGDPGAPRPGFADPGKVIVEHTNINPNKAAHIGHLRNAVLGDTLVRALRYLGRRVEVQNYIDDTGVQVADLVVGFEDLGGPTPSEVARRPGRFDYYCWDLYAQVTALYEAEPERRKRREETLHRMEAGDNPTAALAADLSGRIVRCHLATMARIGVTYELLPRESDILRLQFWSRAFELLRERGAVHLEAAGKNRGCWVMDLSGDPEFADIEDTQKVLVRSNSTVTYTGKDIAYQLWKFGLLGRDFGYRRLPDPPAGHPVWITSSDGGEPDAPAFGGGSLVYNVIDQRQAYPQKVVAKGLAALGFGDAAARSHHFSYEMVALTPACAADLGMALDAEDRARPWIEMSGRRGLGVKADDLLDRLIERAAAEVRRRHADLEPGDVEAIARQLAVGALRYFMLRFTRNRVIAFDLDEVLAFEGETGPYVQYSVVRARNILNRLREREGVGEEELERLVATGIPPSDPQPPDEEWELALLCSRLGEVVADAVGKEEMSGIARHAFALAQSFNSYYHRFQVLGETDPAVRRRRILLVVLFRAAMERALGIMGVEVPPRM